MSAHNNIFSDFGSIALRSDVVVLSSPSRILNRPLGVVGLGTAVVGLLNTFSLVHDGLSVAGVLCAGVAAMCGVMAGVLVTAPPSRPPPRWLPAATMYAALCMLAVLDLYRLAMGRERWWLLAVPLIRVSHDAGVATAHVRAGVACFLAWMVATSLERVVRYGLVDAGGEFLPDYGSRHAAVQCSAPPCTAGAGVVMGDLAGAVLALTAMYYAGGYGHNHEPVEDSIVVDCAAEFAACLSSFNLDAAADVLDEYCDVLPPQLESTFVQCVVNLRLLKPFLPDTLFSALSPDVACETHEYAESAPVVVTAPPGLGRGEGALCFTDIVSSSMLWEDCPEGMHMGLKIHNNVIRGAIAECQGYEVKTIGDCFMVAFEDIAQAVRFGLLVHEGLLDATWPATLLEVPLCSRDRAGLWGGLKVRIGINSGPMSIEKNDVLDRYDYFGGTVNVAARVESKCPPGAVALPAASYETLQAKKEGGLIEGTYVAYSIGKTKLKGIKEEVDVYVVHSARLAGRRDGRRDTISLSPRSQVSVPRSHTSGPPLGQNPSVEDLDASGFGGNPRDRSTSIASGAATMPGLGLSQARNRRLSVMEPSRRPMKRKVTVAGLNVGLSFFDNPLNSDPMESSARPHPVRQFGKRRVSMMSGSRFMTHSANSGEHPEDAVGVMCSPPMTPVTPFTPGFGAAVMPKRTLQPLNPVHSASVAQVSLRVPLSMLASTSQAAVSLNEALDRVLVVTAQTNGRLTCVSGSAFTVTWNVSQSCPHHRATSFYFLRKLYMLMQVNLDPEPMFHCGLSAGAALEGPLGSGSSKFITVVGPCVKIAHSLCDEAMTQNVTCLCASMDKVTYGQVRSCTSAVAEVGTWKVVRDVANPEAVLATSSRLQRSVQRSAPSAGIGGAYGEDPMVPSSPVTPFTPMSVLTDDRVANGLCVDLTVYNVRIERIEEVDKYDTLLRRESVVDQLETSDNTSPPKIEKTGSDGRLASARSTSESSLDSGVGLSTSVKMLNRSPTQPPDAAGAGGVPAAGELPRTMSKRRRLAERVKEKKYLSMTLPGANINSSDSVSSVATESRPVNLSARVIYL